MTGLGLAVLITIVATAAWLLGRADLRRQLTAPEDQDERDRLLDELDNATATITRLLRRCTYLEQQLTRARRP